MGLNQLTLGKEGASARLIEFLQQAQPGSKLKLTLDNGVSKIEGEVLIDENLDDRTAGRIKIEGGQDIGGGCGEAASDDDDKDEPAPPAPKSGAGASIMAVLSTKK